MSTSLKHIIRNILPPIIFDGMRNLCPGNKKKNQLLFTGDYRSWEDAEQASTGYAAGNILEITRAAMVKVRDGEAVYEQDSVVFAKPEYPYPLLTGLLRIALSSGRLNVLDFGGALGSTYFQCRSFLKPLNDLRWSVVEQPSHVACGQAEFTNVHLHFYPSVDNCLKNESPNTLVLSSVLQYLSKPYETLQQLLAWRIPHVLIDRTAFVVGDRDRLTVQSVPETIYPASYPAWFFCEAKFSKVIDAAGYRVVDAFTGADHVQLDEGKSYFKGFILDLDT